MIDSVVSFSSVLMRSISCEQYVMIFLCNMFILKYGGLHYNSTKIIFSGPYSVLIHNSKASVYKYVQESIIQEMEVAVSF